MRWTPPPVLTLSEQQHQQINAAAALLRDVARYLSPIRRTITESITASIAISAEVALNSGDHNHETQTQT